MAVPLTVKQYMVRQWLAVQLESVDSIEALLEDMGQPTPDGKGADTELASWEDAVKRVQRKLTS